jgi:SAM-dependent methyltransferase
MNYYQGLRPKWDEIQARSTGEKEDGFYKCSFEKYHESESRKYPGEKVLRLQFRVATGPGGKWENSVISKFYELGDTYGLSDLKNDLIKMEYTGYPEDMFEFLDTTAKMLDYEVELKRNKNGYQNAFINVSAPF